MAQLLLDRGFRNVRPLQGGFDAWVAEGLPTERLSEEELDLHARVA